MAVDPIGQPLLDIICIEIKRGYSSKTLADLTDKRKSAAVQEWEKWILQANQSATNADSQGWAIISQRDRREPIITIPHYLYRELPLKGSCPRMTLNVEVGEINFLLTTVHLKEFLDIDPSVIRRLR